MAFVLRLVCDAFTCSYAYTMPSLRHTHRHRSVRLLWGPRGVFEVLPQAFSPAC